MDEDTAVIINKKLLAIQKEEMSIHKWYLSEKAMRDLGTDAILDWITKYASIWREKYNSDLEEEINIIKEELLNSHTEVTDDDIKKKLLLWLDNYKGPKYT